MFDLLIFGVNNGSLYSLNVNGKLSKKKLTEKLTVLEEEGGFVYLMKTQGRLV